MFNDLNKVYLYIGTSTDLYDQSLISFLSKKERNQASLFLKAEDRKNFITCRYFLKKFLSDYKKTNIDQIQLKYGTNGKPFLANENIYFNVSHSHDTFVIAITKLGLIGADIELKEKKFDFGKLMDLIFGDIEKEEFKRIPERDKHRAFLNCWTRKEAFFKAKGSGLTSPLHEFKVSFHLDKKPEILETKWDKQEKNDWTLKTINDLSNYVGALAVETNGVSPIIEQFNICNPLNVELNYP